MDILNELHYLYDKNHNPAIQRAMTEIQQLRADVESLLKLLESKATHQEVMDAVVPNKKK
jgi:hypothetical protein